MLISKIQINKHMARVDGVPWSTALWTCMTSIFIRGQSLTLTKSHTEREGPLMGIANSAKLYGYNAPEVVFSDDPIKVSALSLYIIFIYLNQS
jgi:hypothetical protein